MTQLAIVALALLTLTGCGGAMLPLTSGSHVPGDSTMLVGAKADRYAVWSNHPAASQYLTGVLLSLGHVVVERVKLEQIFDEQKVRLVHTSEREADVLHVGRLAGATYVIFAEVRQELPIGLWNSASRMVSVTLRSVAVESGTVRWTGTAAYPEPPANPDQAVLALSYWAFTRAVCPTDHGWRWVEPTRPKQPGCVAPTGDR